MKHEEELDEFFKVCTGIVQLHIEHLDVAGGSTAHLPVGRILHGVRVGTHKADLGTLDSAREAFLKVLDDVLFGSPVAT